MSHSSLRNRLFQQIFRLTRSLTLGVRGIVQDTNGRVLLIRHTYTPGWHFPGGGVEKNETAEFALARELVEEAGIQITGRPRLFGVYSNKALFPNDHVLVYVIENWSQVPATSKGEIAETGFFALDDLPDGITEGTASRLKEVFENQPVSAYWSHISD